MRKKCKAFLEIGDEPVHIWRFECELPFGHKGSHTVKNIAAQYQENTIYTLTWKVIK